MIGRQLLWACLMAALLTGLGLGLRSIYTHGFDAGTAAAAQQARVDADARLVEDRRVADELITESLHKQLLAEDSAAQLQQELARHGRTSLLRTAACGGAGDGAVPGGGGPAAGPGVRAPGAGRGADADVPPQLPGQPAELRLSAAAVRLWNSALAGAQVPAGACRSADPADPACAAATQHTVDDAWSNHIENAKRCQVDRLHLQRLIDFLQARQGAASAPAN